MILEKMLQPRKSYKIWNINQLRCTIYQIRSGILRANLRASKSTNNEKIDRFLN